MAEADAVSGIVGGVEPGYSKLEKGNFISSNKTRVDQYYRKLYYNKIQVNFFPATITYHHI